MAKFSGLVGFSNQVESSPGVWSSGDNSRTMKGDLIKQSSNVQNGDKVNNDVTLGHRVSLLGDNYAFENYVFIRWVEVNKRKWTVSSIEIQRPRIIVSLGGLWNE